MCVSFYTTTRITTKAIMNRKLLCGTHDIAQFVYCRCCLFDFHLRNWSISLKGQCECALLRHMYGAQLAWKLAEIIIAVRMFRRMWILNVFVEITPLNTFFHCYNLYKLSSQSVISINCSLIKNVSALVFNAIEYINDSRFIYCCNNASKR